MIRIKVRFLLYRIRFKAVLLLLRFLRRRFPKSVLLNKICNFYDPNNVRRHSNFTHRELRIVSAGLDGEIMLLDLNQHIDYKFFFFGYFDNLPRKLISLMGPKENILFVDVGANVGLVSIPIAMMGFPTISIEPLPKHINKFKNNLILNPTAKLKLVQSAVGSKEVEGNTRNLKLYSPPGNSGATSADPAWNPSFGAAETFEVPIASVDELCFEILPELYFSKVLVKIDVEGMELDVLSGCEDLIRAYRPVFLIEWKPINHILERFNQLDHFLRQYSYKLQVIPSTSRLHHSEFDPNQIYENLIVMPKEVTIFPNDLL